jgi:flagellar FliL protein
MATKEKPEAKQADADAPEAAAPPARSKKKLILMGAPVLLVLAGAGGWYAFFGAKHKPPQNEASAPPTYIDMPEIIANLDSDPRRPRYIKLRARVEVTGPENERAVREAMPRLQDMFQTYLRDTRPEDLRGSMGTYRLREELIARADIAAAPAHVRDVLFVEMIVQ